jgi:CAAX prenyl protease-like protein
VNALTPLQVRVLPFAIFVAFTFAQGWFGEASRYWIYALKSGMGAVLIWMMWPRVAEMRWRFTWESVVAGVFVAVLWIGPDPFYPKLSSTANPTLWNPHQAFGEHSVMAWFFVVARILGSTIVVPPLEEVFYRSFLYRYLANPDFQSVSLRGVRWIPFAVTCVVFGLAHHEWLAGILCGAIYQALVCRSGRLGDAITAHAITNLLLGLWIIWQGAWHFW